MVEDEPGWIPFQAGAGPRRWTVAVAAGGKGC
jgi:hypothetical protein